MTYDPFKNARDEVDHQKGQYSLGLATVERVPDTERHVVIISPLSESVIDSDSGPVPAEVSTGTVGEVSIPSEGDLVIFGKFSSGRVIVLRSVYSEADDPPEYSEGDRIVGNEDGYMAVREDGTVEFFDVDDSKTAELDGDGNLDVAGSVSENVTFDT